MMAAITAARAGASVTVYEHRGEAGRKLLMTGNGKCNLTNRRMDARYYHSGCKDGENMIRSVLAGFDEMQTLAFFHEIGLLTYERDGYVYPQSEQAVTVRDVLVRECLIAGVSIHYDTDVYPLLEYQKDMGYFVIGSQRYDCLILACGGKSERQTGSDGSGYEIAKRFGHQIATPLRDLFLFIQVSRNGRCSPECAQKRGFVFSWKACYRVKRAGNCSLRHRGFQEYRYSN